MPRTKEFKTIDEQIENLRGRELKFKDEENAKKVLKQYNYFDVINGFESILKSANAPKKYKNIYFEDFSSLFFFDMKLKELTLSKILDIEARLRTSIAYNFSATYCSTIPDTLNYLNKKFYKAPPITDTYLTKKFNNFDLFRVTQYHPNGKIKSRSFLDELKQDKPYIKQYSDPPFWVVIKALPLGTLYFTFIFLDDTVKQKVLNDFNLELSDSDSFIQALFILKQMRNECAHLELITRFKLKSRRYKNLNNFNSIRTFARLSQGDFSYLDVLKTLNKFGSIANIKVYIFYFYVTMFIKRRKCIADKILSKMGRKKLFVWLKL